MTATLPSVPPPQKPPSTARGVAPVLLGAGIALVLGVLLWLPLLAAEHLFSADRSDGTPGPAEGLLGARYDGFPNLALASAAVQGVLALLLTFRLWRVRRSLAISIVAFAPPVLFVSWVLWLLAHVSWC